MSYLRFTARFGVLVSAFAAAVALHAQTSPSTATPNATASAASILNPPPTLAQVVVTATRVATPIAELVADVTVIDRDEIARAGDVGLADLLARVPGIEIARNGGIGNSTTVFVRGGESRHTVVLVDGVRLDSQVTSGGANWSALPMAQIDHIEIVRGPTSTVYGSDAIAGVVQIFTRKGSTGFSPSITLGAGTYNTQTLDAALSGGNSQIDYAIGISGARSDGFNVRPIASQNPDTDGYLSNNGSLRLGAQITPTQRLELLALQSRMDAQYDNGLTNDYRSVTTDATQSLQWMSQWSPQFSSRMILSLATDQGLDLPANSTNQTLLNTASWFGEYKFGAQLVNTTLEQRNTEFQQSGTSALDKSVSQTGIGLGYGWTQGPHSVQLSARNDNDSEWGGNTTSSAAYAYAIDPAWRASVSSASSFRVPTLYQRFSKYGVASLLPESGRNVELGLKYAAGSDLFAVVVYRNQVTNLLTFLSGSPAAGCPVPANGCYANTAQAQYRGITFSGAHRFGEVRGWGSYDLQDPRDSVSGNLLARRATQHATLGAETVWSDWTLAADWQLSSLRYDDAANTTVLPGYGLLGLSAERALQRNWRLRVRLDNATDTNYQLANTYATPGRGLYVSLQWAP